MSDIPTPGPVEGTSTTRQPTKTEITRVVVDHLDAIDQETLFDAAAFMVGVLARTFEEIGYPEIKEAVFGVVDRHNSRPER